MTVPTSEKTIGLPKTIQKGEFDFANLHLSWRLLRLVSTSDWSCIMPFLETFLNGEGLVRKLFMILRYWWIYNAWACLELTTVLLWNINACSRASISWLLDAPAQHCCFFGGSLSATTALPNISRCPLGKLGLLAFHPDPSPTILWLSLAKKII